ncbi:MAG: hypothetical protein Q9164_006752 [Protoblastenia rupestris]
MSQEGEKRDENGQTAPSIAPVGGNEPLAPSQHSDESGVPWPFDSDSSMHEQQAAPGVDHRLQGYPKVAAFEDCDSSLLIYRKFGWLHNRILLSIQAELAELEAKLIRFDAWDFASGDFRRLHSQRRDFQQQPSVRQEIFASIKAKLAEYGKSLSCNVINIPAKPYLDELLLRVQKIQSFKRPSVRAQTTLFNLMRNTESLVANESEWIRFSPDLAALANDAEYGWFNGFLEDSLNTVSRRLTQVCRPFRHLGDSSFNTRRSFI